MSKGNVLSIVNFSSEHKKYLASNLLNTSQQPWKCEKWQEYSWIILELEENFIIDVLEISNASSAFVEVFVSDSPNCNFNVFVPVFFCMSPSESQHKSKCDRVFTFKQRHFSSFVRDKSWKYIKFVCSQPFNKATRFGLSVIDFSGHKNEAICEKKYTPFGKFKIISNNSDQDYIGNYDLQYKKALRNIYEKPNLPPSKKTKEDEGQEGEKKENEKGINVKRPQKDKSDDRNEKNSKEKSKEERKKKRPITEDIAVPSTSTAELSEGVLSSSKFIQQQPSTSRQSNSEQSSHNHSDKSRKKTPKTKKHEKPFDRLMSHVVFVLSGFRDRAELREKAMAMGARYSQEWNSNCTHLICAFPNTPKYKEVKRLNGRIVSKEWILDSYSKRRLLEWRNFMMGTYEGPDTPDQSEQSDSDAKAIATTANDEGRFGGRATNNTNGDDSDVIYDLDTEDDDD